MDTAPKALIFDVNETLLDLSPLKATIGKALGGKPELTKIWFTMLLQYSLVHTTADQFERFGKIGVACLKMLAENEGISLSDQDARKAVAPIRELPPHPDVPEALHLLHKAGYKMYPFTNGGYRAIREQVKHASIEQYFTDCFSVEGVGLFKPHTHAYRWLAQQIKTPVEDCMMIAAHGWDVSGAIWAGMRGIFLARPGQQAYPLGPQPELVTPTLMEAAQALVMLKS